TAKELSSINNIPVDSILPVGFRLYIPRQPKSEFTTFGYIEPIGDSVSPIIENAAIKHTPLLSFLAPFSYRVNRDGSLTPPPLDRFIEIAHNNNSNISLVLTNLEKGAFNSELVHIILTVQAVQNKLLDQIINISTSVGFNDVHFDFEFIPPEDREAYNTFLRKAKDRLAQAGLFLSTALAPKTSSTQKGLVYEAHDYGAHGEIVDFTVLM